MLSQPAQKLFARDHLAAVGLCDRGEQRRLSFCIKHERFILLRRDYGDGGPFLQRLTFDDDPASNYLSTDYFHGFILTGTGLAVKKPTTI